MLQTIFTFPFFKIVDLMLIISMVRIARIQKIKLRISKFILSDAGLEFRSIPCDETCGFVDDV